MIEQIRNELDCFTYFGVGINNIAKCYVGGDLADDEFLTGFRENINIPVIRYNPLDKTRVSAHIFENEFFLEQYHCFTASAGMALRML